MCFSITFCPHQKLLALRGGMAKFSSKGDGIPFSSESRRGDEGK
jgi:hypothetical protein